MRNKFLVLILVVTMLSGVLASCADKKETVQPTPTTAVKVTDTPTPTTAAKVTDTPTPTIGAQETVTLVPTTAIEVTATPEATEPSVTDTPESIVTSAPSPVPSPAENPSTTNTPEPSGETTGTPTATSTPTPTVTSTPTPTVTSTPTPTATNTPEPTFGPDAGVYNSNGQMVYSWKELIDKKLITVKDDTLTGIVGLVIMIDEESAKFARFVADGSIAKVSDTVRFSQMRWLEEVEMSNLAVITDQLFAYCDDLKAVKCPNAKEIGYRAFLESEPEIVVLSDSLEVVSTDSGLDEKWLKQYTFAGTRMASPTPIPAWKSSEKPATVYKPSDFKWTSNALDIFAAEEQSAITVVSKINTYTKSLGYFFSGYNKTGYEDYFTPGWEDAEMTWIDHSVSVFVDTDEAKATLKPEQKLPYNYLVIEIESERYFNNDYPKITGNYLMNTWLTWYKYDKKIASYEILWATYENSPDFARTPFFDTLYRFEKIYYLALPNVRLITEPHGNIDTSIIIVRTPIEYRNYVKENPDDPLCDISIYTSVKIKKIDFVYDNSLDYLFTNDEFDIPRHSDLGYIYIYPYTRTFFGNFSSATYKTDLNKALVGLD